MVGSLLAQEVGCARLKCHLKPSILDGDVAMVAMMQQRKCTPSTTMLVILGYLISCLPFSLLARKCQHPKTLSHSQQTCQYQSIRHCQVLSGTVKHCQALSGTIRYYHVEHCWTLLDTVEHCWTLLDTTEHCWTLQRIIGHYGALLDTIEDRWTLQKIVGHY